MSDEDQEFKADEAAAKELAELLRRLVAAPGREYLEVGAEVYEGDDAFWPEAIFSIKDKGPSGRSFQVTVTCA